MSTLQSQTECKPKVRLVGLGPKPQAPNPEPAALAKCDDFVELCLEL